MECGSRGWCAEEDDDYRIHLERLATVSPADLDVTPHPLFPPTPPLRVPQWSRYKREEFVLVFVCVCLCLCACVCVLVGCDEKDVVRQCAYFQ